MFGRNVVALFQRKVDSTLGPCSGLALDPADRREDSRHTLTVKPARMPIKYTSLALVALGTLFQTLALCAQGADQASPGAPRVFFDCQGPECDDT